MPWMSYYGLNEELKEHPLHESFMMEPIYHIQVDVLNHSGNPQPGIERLMLMIELHLVKFVAYCPRNHLFGV
jgi:hypothetical protein